MTTDVACKCGQLHGTATLRLTERKTRTAGSGYLQMHYTVTGEFFVHERGMIRCGHCGELALTKGDWKK